MRLQYDDTDSDQEFSESEIFTGRCHAMRVKFTFRELLVRNDVIILKTKCNLFMVGHLTWVRQTTLPEFHRPSFFRFSRSDLPVFYGWPYQSYGVGLIRVP